MDFVYRLLMGLVFAGAGLYFLVRTRKFVHMVGTIDWAEAHLGSGGTYTLMKLLGIIAIVFGVILGLGIVKLW